VSVCNGGNKGVHNLAAIDSRKKIVKSEQSEVELMLNTEVDTTEK
jgi:hypothetical protein